MYIKSPKGFLAVSSDGKALLFSDACESPVHESFDFRQAVGLTTQWRALPSTSIPSE